MPTRMNAHSTRRALTYPSASASLCRLTIGKITTAVPMFAMMSSSSSKTPNQIRLFCPGTRDVADGVVEHRLVEQQSGYRRDERDAVEHAEDTRRFLVRGHAHRPPFPRR